MRALELSLEIKRKSKINSNETRDQKENCPSKEAWATVERAYPAASLEVIAIRGTGADHPSST
jgi:DNA-binding IscR family transcriptional regulator